MTTVKAVDPNQTVPASVEAAPNVAPALSEEAKKQLDLVEKQITDELDPVNQILNNPNLTQEQKTEAVKQVQEVLAVKEGQKKSKILLFAGIGIAVILGVVFIMSGKKGSK